MTASQTAKRAALGFAGACLLLAPLMVYLNAILTLSACPDPTQPFNGLGFLDMLDQLTRTNASTAWMRLVGMPLLIFLSPLPAASVPLWTARRWARWLTMAPPFVIIALTAYTLWHEIAVTTCTPFATLSLLAAPIGAVAILAVTAATSLTAFALIRLGRLPPSPPKR